MGLFDKWKGKQPSRPSVQTTPAVGPSQPGPAIVGNCGWCHQPATSLQAVLVDLVGLANKTISMGPCCAGHHPTKLEWTWNAGKCACGRPGVVKAQLYRVIRPGNFEEVLQASGCFEHTPAVFWSGRNVKTSLSTVLPTDTCHVCGASATACLRFEGGQVPGFGASVRFCTTHLPAQHHAKSQQAAQAAQQKALDEREARACGKAICSRCNTEQLVYATPRYDGLTDARLDDAYNCVVCDQSISKSQVRMGH